MTYALTTTVEASVPDAIAQVKAALAEQGFGVLTEIDMKATLKTKLDVDVPEHVILGACNPPLAHRAVTLDPSVGLLLPCNVVVRADAASGRTVVEAIDPAALAPALGSSGMTEVADEARERLGAAIAALSGSL
jgi:uncharacterized protein (DUF302 family)